MISAGSEIHFEVAKQAAMLNGLDNWLLGNNTTQMGSKPTPYSNSKASTSTNGGDYFKHENLKQQHNCFSEMYSLVCFLPFIFYRIILFIIP